MNESDFSLTVEKSEIPLIEEKQKPEISLVMPAYNEGAVIEEAVKRVMGVAERAGLNYELIVVDDGSVDDTRARLLKYVNNHSRIKVAGYAKNMGKGYAIKTGFANSKGDIVIFIDSDLDIDSSQIIHYIKALKYNDIAVASKWHPESKAQVPLIRKILSYCFNMLVKALTGIRLSDTQTGLKAARKEALEKIFSRLTVKRYAFDVELLLIANLQGLKIAELPVTIKLQGLFNPKDIWRMFMDLLGITFRLRALKWYQQALSEGCLEFRVTR